MTIGDRIKKIRKELDLTQAEFGARIGSVQNTVTGYESGRRNPSAPVVALICEKFNINEDWLKTGTGEMFKPTPSDALDQLAREYNLSNASYIAIEKFVNLKPEKRRELIEFFLEISKAIIESGDNPESIPNSPEELEKQFPPLEADVSGKVG